MVTIEQRLLDKEKECIGLSRRNTIKEGTIQALRLQLKETIERAVLAETTLSPVQESLNRMTAENSKFRRKMKRLGAKNE